MLITDILSRSNVLFKLPARDKGAVLEALARHAAGALGIDYRPVLKSLSEREALGSTGMGGGMAIPHAYLPGLAAPIGVLARLEAPVDFDAVDRQPVDIVFLLLLTVSRDATPLNAMACAARGLRDPDVIGDLLSASNASELYDAVRSRKSKTPATAVSG